MLTLSNDCHVLIFVNTFEHVLLWRTFVSYTIEFHQIYDDVFTSGTVEIFLLHSWNIALCLAKKC